MRKWFALLALVVALPGCGLFKNETDIVSPVGCPFTISAQPIAGFPGVYTVGADPGGAFELTINGTARSTENGIVAAVPGDIAQGRRVGCSSPAVVLR